MDAVGDKIEAQGMLVDLAPTILEMLGLEKPAGMIGHSLMDQLKAGNADDEDEMPI